MISQEVLVLASRKDGTCARQFRRAPHPIASGLLNRILGRNLRVFFSLSDDSTVSTRRALYRGFEKLRRVSLSPWMVYGEP